MPQPRIVLQRPQRGAAIHARHVQVEDDQAGQGIAPGVVVGRPVVQVVEQLLAIVDELQPVRYAAFAEGLAGEQAVVRVIVGNQDGRG
ncbi:hypothetical protein D3C78_1495870 [compost metagenome]